MKRVLIICLLLYSQIAMAEISQDEVQAFFYGYVAALKAGDNRFALNHWSLLDRTWSDQLGIRYKDTPIKVDAGSQILENLDALKAGTAKVTVDTITVNRGFARISYSLKTQDTTYTGVYYAVTTSTVEPSLASTLRVFTESWEQAEGKYFDLTYRDLTLLQNGNITAADQFVEETAKTLGISDAKMANLEKAKFRIILCESYGEVQMLTGLPAHGVFYRPLDAVVSKFLPPYHEIAQLLVAYANDSIPYYTLPFIEEGTATFLGGRWGRSPEVMLYVGSYIYLNNYHEWDKLLTYDGFRGMEDNPDFSYPVAGLFCKFLFEKLGHEKYFKLYRELSGSEEQVKAITQKKFESLAAAATGKSWTVLESEFKAFVKTQKYAGISAGAPNKGKLVYESGTPNFSLRILEDSAHYNVFVSPKADGAKAALLIGSTQTADAYQSSLYKEYFSDNSWQQQHYALMFSTKENEIGTYDFYTNVITGKYGVGFSGESLQKPGSKEYRFQVDKRLLPKIDQQAVKLVPLN